MLSLHHQTALVIEHFLQYVKGEISFNRQFLGTNRKIERKKTEVIQCQCRLYYAHKLCGVTDYPFSSLIILRIIYDSLNEQNRHDVDSFAKP